MILHFVIYVKTVNNGFLRGFSSMVKYEGGYHLF